MSAIGGIADKVGIWPRGGLSANDPKRTLTLNGVPATTELLSIIIPALAECDFACNKPKKSSADLYQYSAKSFCLVEKAEHRPPACNLADHAARFWALVVGPIRAAGRNPNYE